MATNGLVDMEHVVDSQGNSEECADYSEAISAAHKEVLDRLIGKNLTEDKKKDIEDEIIDIVEATQDYMNINAKDMILNEIMMIDDTAGVYNDFKVAKIGWNLSVSLGFATCALDTGASACASPRHNDNITDILLRHEEVGNDSLAIPGGDDVVDRSDALLNTCIGRKGDGAYGTLVHEAGHVLGIRDGQGHGDWVGSVNHHPTIPGTVMNYENRNLKELPAWFVLPSEPDCSPHPFDIMAIYALYQTVD